MFNTSRKPEVRVYMVRRSDGRWQQSVTDTDAFGRRKTKYFYGKTKSELLQKIAAYNAEAAGRKRGVTFQTLADGWWEEAEPALAPNTTKGYKAAMRRAAGHFGTAYAQELRPVDMSRFIKTFCKETNAAEKTARNQLSVISLILSWGVDHGYLDTNVAREVSVPKGLPKRKVEMPSSEDIRRVKENTDLPFGMFAYWAMYTGLRHGELLALTWEDVNIEKRTITVNKSLYHVGGQKTKAPKTEAGTRVLPLLDRLAEKITPGTGLIFPNRHGEYMSSGTFTKKYDAYRRASGVTCTPHQLRHAFTTMLIEAGVEPTDAQGLLGHAQLSTTMDIYREIREIRQEKVRASVLAVDIE